MTRIEKQEKMIKKAHEFYQYCNEQDIFELEEIAGSAETREENDFYLMVINHFLQARQREIINGEFIR